MLQRIRVGRVSFFLAALWAVASPAQEQNPHARWEPDIKAFEESDVQNPPAEGGILFVGSSSIRLWDLAKSFPHSPTINRGFGGSEISDATYFFDRIVTKYAPRAVVLYAGDNDISRDKTPERVHADFRAFAKKVHAALPEAMLFFIAIKPSLQRWKLVETMRAANRLIRADCEQDDRLTFVDIATPTLGEDGKPKPELFVKDGLHLSAQGYDLWAKVVAAELQIPAVSSDQWLPLFNGKDLDGWTPKIKGYESGDNFADTFRVEDGVLKVAYDGYEKFGDKFGHLFYREPFSHYRLRVEYRFTGEQVAGGPSWAVRNSGLMLHGESPETMAKEQNFPVSIEVQLLGGDGTNPRPTANLCTPGTNVVMDGKLVTRHCTNSKSKTYHGEGWVTVEVEVRGNEVIKHIVDGQVVLEYNQPQLDERDAHAKVLAEGNKGIQLDRGTISLQSESHPVEFRKVELLGLDQ